MEEDLLNRMLDTATGEAIYAAASQATLWAILVKKGVVTQDEAREAIDLTMLVFEKRRETRPGGGPGAIDYALSRLEALLRQLSQATKQPP